MARIEWTGDAQVKAQMAAYGRKVREAELRLLKYFSAVIQTEARRDASWTDQTSNARQALRAYTSDDPPGKFGAGTHEYPNPADLARDAVALYLAHGMDYGLFLETKYAGRYAVIMQTLRKYYPEITRQLKAMFG
jgi:hypothetical protein